MKCDLHCHSTRSDGSMRPEEILRYGKRLGLDAVALTDHDTLQDPRLQEEADRLGIRLVPGVEITTRDPDTGRPVHLLCYCYKRPLVLKRFLNRTLASRRAQKLRMAELAAEKYPLNAAMVLRQARGSQSIYECHIMQLLEDMGYTERAMGPLCGELLGKRGSCYVPSHYPTVYQALEVIRRSGGKAVMAHPGQFDSLALLDRLGREGLLAGVEYWHPRNSPEVQKEIQQIAQACGLFLTGGTDFHGAYSSRPLPLGSFTCGAESLQAVLGD